MRPHPANRKFGAETFFWPWPAFPVGCLVLLVGSFLYVWLRVEPLLEYHRYGPFFFRQRAFLETFLHHPGGLANYAGVFLAQLNCVNWVGALVFVLLECLVLFVALICLHGISGRAPGVVALVPGFVLLLLRNHYRCPVFALTVGLLLALGSSAVCVLLPGRRPWRLTALSGFISALLFFLAGLWSALLFAVLTCWFVSIPMRNWLGGLACLGLGLVAPLAVMATGGVGLAKLLNPWPEGVHWVLAAALYASVPIGAAVLALLPQPPPAVNSQGVSQNQATDVRRPVPWVRSAPFGQTGLVLGLLLGWAAVWLTFDHRQKLLAEIDYYSGRGQYEAVLAAARQINSLNHPAKVRLHLALYHTGRLAEELFSFHNMVDDEPLKAIGEDWRAQSQPLFELGLINDAEHMAHDAAATEGDRPDLLSLLARINVLKDRPQAAQVFLNVLSLIPFQGQRANDAWPAMDPRMPAAEGATLARLRARVLTNDAPHDGLPVGPLLEILLASNPTNQMAFEYLMAQYLMELKLNKAIECLQLLDNFNYTRIPRSYEEALLLYQLVAGVQLELKSRTIRPETADRFRQFRQAARQLKGTAGGRAAMAANFGDTYWYYFAARSGEQAAEDQASAP